MKGRATSMIMLCARSCQHRNIYVHVQRVQIELLRDIVKQIDIYIYIYMWGEHKQVQAYFAGGSVAYTNCWW